MNLLREPNRLGDVLKYEAPNHYSREECVLAQGQALKLGTVVGKRTKEEIQASEPDILEDLRLGLSALPGEYRLIADSAESFHVITPQGFPLAPSKVDEPYDNGHFALRLKKREEPYEQGKILSLMVRGSNTLAPFNPLGENGTERPVGVLLHDCDATAKDTKAVIITRHAIVSDKGLVWPEAITEAQKQEAIFCLQSRGILIRQGV